MQAERGGARRTKATRFGFFLALLAAAWVALRRRVKTSSGGGCRAQSSPRSRGVSASAPPTSRKLYVASVPCGGRCIAAEEVAVVVAVVVKKLPSTAPPFTPAAHLGGKAPWTHNAYPRYTRADWKGAGVLPRPYDGRRRIVLPPLGAPPHPKPVLPTLSRSLPGTVQERGERACSALRRRCFW